MMKTVSCLILLLVATSAIHHTCGLGCENGSVCRRVSSENDELSLLVQSGKLIETCDCPTRHIGIGCEILKQECDTETNKCPNGKACTKSVGADGTIEHDCDCSLADEVSKFAGIMCRHPYTEYCANHYNPEDEVTSYCTNGGKCKNSIVGAQVAPGDTSVNEKFRHLGCFCPADFYGTHCELLRYDHEKAAKDSEDAAARIELRGENQRSQTNEDNEDERTQTDKLFIGLLSFVLMLLVAYPMVFLYRKCCKGTAEIAYESRPTYEYPAEEHRTLEDTYVTRSIQQQWHDTSFEDPGARLHHARVYSDSRSALHKSRSGGEYREPRSSRRSRRQLT